MPKLILKTPEEYTAFPILVDGVTYDVVTVGGPQTHTSEISKSTLLQLEEGLTIVDPDLTELNQKVADLEEWKTEHESEYAELLARVDQLPTTSGSTDLTEINTQLTALTNSVNDLTTAVSAIQNALVTLTGEVGSLKTRVDALESQHCCCNTTSTCNCGTTTNTPSTGTTTTTPTTGCTCGC